jgi:hypothetical protein
MPDWIAKSITELLVKLTVAAVTAIAVWSIAWWRGRQKERRIFERKIEGAPRIYVERLGTMIVRAINEGKDNAIINAKAIVDARDSMRRSLISIGQHLNSTIDDLAQAAGRASKRLNVTDAESPGPHVQGDAVQCWENIQILQRTWDGKREIVESEFRKLLAEAGLVVTISGENRTPPATTPTGAPAAGTPPTGEPSTGTPAAARPSVAPTIATPLNVQASSTQQTSLLSTVTKAQTSEAMLGLGRRR